MKPNFKNIDIYAGFQPQNGMEWQKENGITADWKTPEHINVKPVYTKEDLEGMEHLNYVAGIPPYLRGPYSMMYTFRPWTIRQYAGFSTAEESNAFYRRNLASGHEYFSRSNIYARNYSLFLRFSSKSGKYFQKKRVYTCFK